MTESLLLTAIDADPGNERKAMETGEKLELKNITTRRV